MSVKLLFDDFDPFHNFANEEEKQNYLEKCELDIHTALAIFSNASPKAIRNGIYNGKWYKIEIREAYNGALTLNVYYETTIVLQANRDLYGDWTIFMNQIDDYPSLREVFLSKAIGFFMSGQ